MSTKAKVKVAKVVNSKKAIVTIAKKSAKPRKFLMDAWAVITQEGKLVDIISGRAKAREIAKEALARYIRVKITEK